MSESADFQFDTLAAYKTARQLIDGGAALLLEGGPIRLVMERLTKKRTHSQNDMHCGLCRDIAEALKERTGLDYDVEYMRAKTKRKFGVVVSQPDPETGKAEPYLMSTTKYSKEQFSKLIDGTLAWAYTDLRISVSDPRAA